MGQQTGALERLSHSELVVAAQTRVVMGGALSAVVNVTLCV